MTLLTLLGLLGFTLLCVAVCYYFALKRGLDIRFWIIMGAVFGPLAIPAVIMARPKKPKSGDH